MRNRFDSFVTLPTDERAWSANRVATAEGGRQTFYLRGKPSISSGFAAIATTFGRARRRCAADTQSVFITKDAER
jgi:hypothetical protein